jgi:hypothetical protein
VAYSRSCGPLGEHRGGYSLGGKCSPKAWFTGWCYWEVVEPLRGGASWDILVGHAFERDCGILVLFSSFLIPGYEVSGFALLCAPTMM